ncbi:hypothetical protein ASPVEDRAFT_39833 [Aspergillus versicolor CBS 583.65]|uniref:Uncharacterized protein n=1 Tax=Aspergillus versicolor CBS 583.65 TaxID=1036611 RepID=A0A1L9PFW2_ASPVE|nr:uncharacterized protein ASPVEDRAFT_39833 [Aspergillus versicolor CBS 583.65]OJJ00379.1 hypothetical protein ASPVEDRAFT_39833 [Aspergillus versicolor CBS 583.65]
MTSYLYPARFLCLQCRSSLRPSFAAPSRASTIPRVGWRLQWNNQYSVGVKRPVKGRVFNSGILKAIGRLRAPKWPIPQSQGRRAMRFKKMLYEYLSLISRDAAMHPTRSTPEAPSLMTRYSFTRTVELAHHLNTARTELKRDLLAHLGFKAKKWSTVYEALSRLADAAEAVKGASHHNYGAIENRASSSGVSLDQLTDSDISPPTRTSQAPKIIGLDRLDAITYRPFDRDYYMLLMGQIWTSLGSIILHSADASPAESKLAMSIVYRILARLHHSGLVSERVYMYATPEIHQASFRPPGIHLLSSYIMDVLSDAAWLVHEAEVAAEAAAAGKEAPFLPAKIGIKELGHEIWFEFVLWCCVEHGHINEGVWLINQSIRKDWNFQSWVPLLRDEKLLRNTRIDRDITTWPSPGPAVIKPEPPNQTGVPSPFHGLGRRIISTEVVAALMDNLPNSVHMGMGSGGTPANELLHDVSSLKFAILSPTTSDSKFLPTTKRANWFITRIMESGGLAPEADPQLFDGFLKLTPHVVPPWNNDMCPVEENLLAKLHPSQLYDETTALTGLMAYNLNYHSSQGFCGSALRLFAILQDVMDTCKMQRVDEFFLSQVENAGAALPLQELDSFTSPGPLSSSNPQLSLVTIAHLFDLITTSRAFAFGEWLLLSNDVDGPTVPISAYGDQALAPSLLRFAAATKNNPIGEAVIRELAEPVSVNTLRALLNYRITMHHWHDAIPLLKYMRDHRLKSWSHNNIASIVAEIIRLDHSLSLQQSSDLTRTTAVDLETDLAEAKKILYRILFGEFDEIPWRTRSDSRFQANTFISFTRLFHHLSSPSLHEILDTVVEPEHAPMYRLPYIPSTAFNVILSAVAETKGSLAARSIYERFCVSYTSPEINRTVQGGITRFYTKATRDYQKGDPNFDAKYARHLQEKLVYPNANTVRILAQAAIRDYDAAVSEMKSESTPEATTAHPSNDQNGHFPPTPIAKENHSISIQTPSPSSSPAPEPTFVAEERKMYAERTLIFCAKRFRAFNMNGAEIAHEIGQKIYARYRKSKKERRERRRKLRAESRGNISLKKGVATRVSNWVPRTKSEIAKMRVASGERRESQRVKREKMKGSRNPRTRKELKRSQQAERGRRVWRAKERQRRRKEMEVKRGGEPLTKAEMRRFRRAKGRERREKREENEREKEMAKQVARQALAQSIISAQRHH